MVYLASSWRIITRQVGLPQRLSRKQFSNLLKANERENYRRSCETVQESMQKVETVVAVCQDCMCLSSSTETTRNRAISHISLIKRRSQPTPAAVGIMSVLSGTGEERLAGTVHSVRIGDCIMTCPLASVLLHIGRMCTVCKYVLIFIDRR